MTVGCSVALFVFFANLALLLLVFRGIKAMRSLSAYPPFSQKQEERLPKVSIIVPARNEEYTVDAGLRSLFAQDYPNLQIIVVNDRSEDGTGRVLARLRRDHPEIVVCEIRDLPAGWLGKSHALWRGAKRADGDYLLFTDADIIMDKTTVSRAVTCMEKDGLEHLSLFFRNIAPGGLLNAMILDVGGGLLALFRPWRVRDPQSRYFMGVGAFNMVERRAYLEVGGHETIKMHPIDDIMLGKILKQGGKRQDCLLGVDFVVVHWYETPQRMIEGLMKNVFAMFDFKVSRAFFAVFLVVVLNILPVWGALLGHDCMRFFFLAAVLGRILTHARGAKAMGGVGKSFAYSLLTPYITVFIVLKSVTVTLVNQGIDWRGTHYSLDMLRKNPSVF